MVGFGYFAFNALHVKGTARLIALLNQECCVRPNFANFGKAVAVAGGVQHAEATQRNDRFLVVFGSRTSINKEYGAAVRRMSAS